MNNNELTSQPQINITANPNVGQVQAQSSNQVGRIISQFGDNLLSTYSPIVGEQNAQRDIDKQQQLIAAGADGQFNHVSQIVNFLNPALAQSYNNAIDKVAIPNTSAQIGIKIANLQNSVKMDSSIPVEQKTQVLSDKIQQAMPELLKNVPEEFKPAVTRLSYSQATDNVQKMLTFTTGVQLQQARMQSLQSMEDWSTLGKQATNIAEANNALYNIKQISSAAVDTGYMTAEEKMHSDKQYSNGILANMAINANITDIPKWNKETGANLTDDQVRDVQSEVNKAWMKSQEQIQVNQLRSGYSFELNYAKVANGYNPDTPTAGFSNEQMAKLQYARFMYQQKQVNSQDKQLEAMAEAKAMGNAINSFKGMSASDRWNLEAGNFDKLPQDYQDRINASGWQEFKPAMQKHVISMLSEYNKNVNQEPYKNLDSLKEANITNQAQSIQNGQPINPADTVDFVERQSILAKNVDAKSFGKNIASPDELSQLRDVGLKDPVLMDKLIHYNYPNAEAAVRQHISSMLPTASLGYTMLSSPGTNETDKGQFLANADKISNKALWFKKLDSGFLGFGDNYQQAMQNLDPVQQQHVISYVNRVSANGLNKPNDILDRKFDILNNSFIAKGDGEILTNSVFKTYQLKKAGIGSQVRYYPSSDTYAFTDKQGNVIPNLQPINGAKLRSVYQNSGVKNYE